MLSEWNQGVSARQKIITQEYKYSVLTFMQVTSDLRQNESSNPQTMSNKIQPSLESSKCIHHRGDVSCGQTDLHRQGKSKFHAILDICKNCLTLILWRSRTGMVWFYTSTSNKRAARPKLYTKSLTRDLKHMYSRFTLVRISIKL